MVLERQSPFVPGVDPRRSNLAVLMGMLGNNRMLQDIQAQQQKQLPPQQYAGPVGPGMSGTIGGVVQPVMQNQANPNVAAAPAPVGVEQKMPPQFTQPLPQRPFETVAANQAQVMDRNGARNLFVQRLGQQFRTPRRGVDMASSFDQRRAAAAGSSLSNGQTRRRPFAEGFSFGERQGRGGRQPVFSEQDATVRQNLMENNNRNVQNVNGARTRRPIFAPRRQA